ncbi:hypothetical protein D3C73_1621060 [compost metagenome]
MSQCHRIKASGINSDSFLSDLQTHRSNPLFLIGARLIAAAITINGHRCFAINGMAQPAEAFYILGIVIS